MKRILFLSAGALPLALLSQGTAPQTAVQTPASKAEVREIRLRQNDAQIHFTSRVFELRHAEPEELLPFVSSAVMRYNRHSTVRCITGGGSKGLLVNTGVDFMPYAEKIIALLDRPGKTGSDGSVLEGTGVCRIAYTPRFRAARQFSEFIDTTLSSPEGKAYVNSETNTIFWRDNESAARETLDWVKHLDRPLPQVQIKLNYYELRDSDLSDWGFDYLAWKNGPGVNLFNVGYNAGRISVDEVLAKAAEYAASASWGYGGFFTAPQFDMSFIRCLEQNGNATMAANATITMINTPVKSVAAYRKILEKQMEDSVTAPFQYRVSLTPEYQNIAKNVLGRTYVGKSWYEDEEGVKHADPPRLEMTIINPFVCVNTLRQKKTRRDGMVIFSYALNFKNVVERGNTGTELSNAAVLTGSVSLACGVEKLLALYEKENDVEQTLGIPILCRIPVLKYLFSTTTHIKERTYIVITAEAVQADPQDSSRIESVSKTAGVKRRIENPLRKNTEE